MVLQPEAVIYIHDHLPHSLTSLFFGSHNAWLLHVQSVCTLFPISLCLWIGCLHCLGHMTVLERGGSFLMSCCFLNHCLYSNHSPSPFFYIFLAISLWFQSQDAMVSYSFVPTFTNNMVDSDLCEWWLCCCVLPHPSFHGNTRIARSSLKLLPFLASFPSEANRGRKLWWTLV